MQILDSGEFDSQGVLQVVVHLEDSSLITTSVTIVGSRKDGDDVLVLRPAVAGRSRAGLISYVRQNDDY